MAPGIANVSLAHRRFGGLGEELDFDSIHFLRLGFEDRETGALELEGCADFGDFSESS